MLIWTSLLFPIIAAVISLIWFRHKVTWWEIFIPFAVCMLTAVIFKWGVETSQVSDNEYWGGLGVKAQYYEPWETWVTQQCSREVACGTKTDSKGNTKTKYCTEYYDCSYCDENSAEYNLVDDQGNSFSISKSYYDELTRRWKSSPHFVELGRSIDYSGGCGYDGDLYEVLWDNQVLTSEPTVLEKTYENRVQAASSSFNFPDVSPEEEKLYGLFQYPDVKGYSQDPVLGDDSIKWITPYQQLLSYKLFSHLNGKWGPLKQAKVWILLFKDKPSLSAKMQEALWKGGNKNEVVICIGLSSQDSRLLWVDAFSWTPNRQLLVDLREDLMSINTYDPVLIHDIVEMRMNSFERKHFKEFSYLTVDPPTWAIIVNFILSAILTALITWWSIRNEHEEKSR